MMTSAESFDLIHLPEIDGMAHQWGANTPLRVTCVVEGSVIQYRELHLDAILSYAVVEMATKGRMLPKSSKMYHIPLPLEIAWEGWGLPLWSVTDMLPVSGAVKDVMYLHRRSPDPHMVNGMNINTTAGAYKDRRTPMPTIRANELTCDVCGNAEAIIALLGTVTSIGKKRHIANTVLEWRVEPIDGFSFTTQCGKTRRVLPAKYLEDVELLKTPLDYQSMAWTPPYWHAATTALCVASGTQL